MANNYGYYLPLADTTFESVRFLGITPKYDGVGHDARLSPVWWCTTATA